MDVLSPAAQADADLDGQYRDRPHLRPVLDALLAAAPELGDVEIVVRRRQVSLVGPLRTFAMVQATSRQRVDVALRLGSAAAGGRLVATRGVEYAVRLELRTPADVDGDAIAALRCAYDENARPRPRRQPAPRPRALEKRPLRLVIEGVDLPGRRCNPDQDGHVHENVHAGLRCDRTGGFDVTRVPGRPWGVIGLVAGDAPRARWDLDVVVKRFADGYDFSGPCVHGAPGNRAVGLAWGDVAADGSFTMFRAMGLRLGEIPEQLVDRAFAGGKQLVGRLGLTDAKGNPRCARVPANDVTWSLAP